MLHQRFGETRPMTLSQTFGLWVVCFMRWSPLNLLFALRTCKGFIRKSSKVFTPKFQENLVKRCKTLLNGFWIPTLETDQIVVKFWKVQWSSKKSSRSLETKLKKKTTFRINCFKLSIFPRKLPKTLVIWPISSQSQSITTNHYQWQQRNFVQVIHLQKKKKTLLSQFWKTSISHSQNPLRGRWNERSLQFRSSISKESRKLSRRTFEKIYQQVL